MTKNIVKLLSLQYSSANIKPTVETTKANTSV